MEQRPGHRSQHAAAKRIERQGPCLHGRVDHEPGAQRRADGSDQLDDPHFVARGFPRWMDQQVTGRIAMEGPAFRATGTRDIVLYQAPRLGEHTREICQELLGLDAETIERLIADGALEVPA